MQSDLVGLSRGQAGWRLSDGLKAGRPGNASRTIDKNIDKTDKADKKLKKCLF